VKDVLASVKETVAGSTSAKAVSSDDVKLPKTMKAVVYEKAGTVVVSSKIETPTLGDPKTGRMEHAAILKVVATAICGSDCHMYRGSAVTPPGLILGHEVTGEIVEIGRDVLYLKVGDLVSVPFPVACGRCTNCKLGQTSICLHTCADHPGAIYGYAGMGEWRGGQAEYFLLPFADFNGLKIPNKDEGLKRILDIALLADVFPTAITAPSVRMSKPAIRSTSQVRVLLASHVRHRVSCAAQVWYSTLYKSKNGTNCKERVSSSKHVVVAT